MTVIWLNGAVGSGKSVVGAALAALLPRGGFVDGDDHAGPPHLPNRRRWNMAIGSLLALARRRPPGWLVVAYPLDGAGFRRVRAGCALARRRLVVVNLATPLPIVLRGRGRRVLSADERRRARAMHGEAYHRRRFAALTLPNALPPAARTARRLNRLLRFVA